MDQNKNISLKYKITVAAITSLQPQRVSSSDFNACSAIIIIIPMAQELNMSVTGYLHIKNVLVPKHLAVSQQSRKKQAFRKDFLQESPSEQAQQLKLRRLKPLGEIEAIMRHFDANFSNANPRKKPLFKDSARRRVDSEDHQDLEQRMSYLLQLPAIANIRREAQRYRNQVNVEEIRQREQRKAQIMSNFKLYMAAEQKGNSDMARKRLYTIN